MATKGRAAALYRRPPEGGGKGSPTWGPKDPRRRT
jgi:hypothetical protein